MTRGERFAQLWQEDREGMLARLEAARAKAAEDQERRRVESDSAFQAFLARQGEALRDERSAPRPFYYERRCVHCGTYFRAPSKEALEALSQTDHGDGLCAKKRREARRRSDAQVARRAKHSAKDAHTAAMLGVSIVLDPEGREDE